MKRFNDVPRYRKKSHGDENRLIRVWVVGNIAIGLNLRKLWILGIFVASKNRTKLSDTKRQITFNALRTNFAGGFLRIVKKRMTMIPMIKIAVSLRLKIIKSAEKIDNPILNPNLKNCFFGVKNVSSKKTQKKIPPIAVHEEVFIETITGKQYGTRTRREHKVNDVCIRFERINIMQIKRRQKSNPLKIRIDKIDFSMFLVAKFPSVS